MLPETNISPHLVSSGRVLAQNGDHSVVDDGVGMAKIMVDFLKNQCCFLLQAFEFKGWGFFQLSPSRYADGGFASSRHECFGCCVLVVGGCDVIVRVLCGGRGCGDEGMNQVDDRKRSEWKEETCK